MVFYSAPRPGGRGQQKPPNECRLRGGGERTRHRLDVHSAVTLLNTVTADVYFNIKPPPPSPDTGFS